MAVSQTQIVVPSNGSQAVVFGNTPVNSSELHIANTGTVAVFLGPQTYLGPPTNFAVTPSATGGTFASGATAYWKITSLNAQGETIASPEITTSFAYPTSTGSANLTWTAVAGATGYKIYRSTTSQGESTSPALVTTIVSGATTSYTGTGAATLTGAVPASNSATLPVLYPLAANASLTFANISPTDLMVAQVQTTGTAGQLTILGVG